MATWRVGAGKTLPGLRAAASRLPQTDAPQDVLDDARQVLDAYMARMDSDDRADMPAIERRVVVADGLRADDGDGVTITGYAALFNTRSADLGGFVETIAPGAFATLATDDVRALWQHNPEYVLGRTKSGTLTLATDERGLRIAATPPNAQWARDAVESIRRGDVDQMSFGFTVVQDRWYTEDNGVRRELLSVRLHDVSPVTYPAYNQTTVTVRNYAQGLNEAQARLAGLGDDAQARARVGLRLREIKLLEQIYEV